MSRNLILVPQALDKQICQVAYLYALYDELKHVGLSDYQVPTAYSKYGDSLMESLLIFLQPTIENATELELYPTYAYYRIYRNGDFLKPHLDRPSCEISASLCLGVNYNLDEYQWPLFVEKKAINLNVGDLAIYKGLEDVHWRNKFDGPANAIQIQAFLHYVDQSGPYSEYKFDQRVGIGFPLTSKSTKDIL